MVTTRSSNRQRVITSAEKVANSEDLLKDILLRLPTKTLLKFKLVSKSWLSLISSPHFGLSHTRLLRKGHSLKPQALLIDVAYKKLPSKFMFLRLNPDTKRLPLFDFIDARNIRILQSCYGLMLCVSQRNNSKSYYICNPVIKKSKMISCPKHPNMSIFCHVGVNFAFDPLKSPHYKILSIWKNENDNEGNTRCFLYFIDIYSSETDFWSVSKFKFISSQNIKFNQAILFNGAIHWDSYDKESIYFDPFNECLKTMSMPMIEPTWDRYLGESDGHLHLISTYGFSYLRIHIFQLEADYSKWFFKYNLHLDARTYVLVPSHVEDLIHRYLLSCAIEYDEEKGDSMLAIFPGGFAISYNLVNGTVKRLRCSNIENNGPDYENFRGSCQYFETLAPV